VLAVLPAESRGAVPSASFTPLHKKVRASEKRANDKADRKKFQMNQKRFFVRKTVSSLSFLGFFPFPSLLSFGLDEEFAQGLRNLCLLGTCDWAVCL
jgi:hypothetical protein